VTRRVVVGRTSHPKYLFCEPNSGLDPNTAILIDNLIEITEEYDITTVIMI
jgi:phospholipid/cholesterol/gamma-HCH transport system ATP-binding protein